MDRALPGPKIDLIRNGIPDDQLRLEGAKGVYNALVKTACSAVQRGWSFHQWADLVTEPESHLGTQLSTRDGRKSRSKIAVEKILQKAWDTAGEWVRHQDAPWTADQARQMALQRVRDLRDFVADPDTDLRALEREILTVAADRAEELGHDRPALPWRIFMERIDPAVIPVEDRNRKGTAVTERRLKDALDQLDRAGLLVVEHRGRSSRDADARRATLRRLPDPTSLSQYRETRSMGQEQWSMGQADQSTLGQPHVYGAGEGVNPHMAITITISAADGTALREAIDVLTGHADVQVHHADEDNVIDLAARRA